MQKAFPRLACAVDRLLATSRAWTTTFLILAIVAAAIVVSTGVWAQTKKSQRAKREITLQARSSVKRADTRNLRERKLAGGKNRTGRMTLSPNDDVFVDPQPNVSRLLRANDFKGDLRNLPQTPAVKKDRPEREPPDIVPGVYGPPNQTPSVKPEPSSAIGIAPAAPAPTPLLTFGGLDFANWGAGRPPDTVGDVGPNYYIEAVNTSIGIFNKTGGPAVAAFTFDTFMSQGSFGNLCDTDNFGDPVVLYDSFEDRWIITDFAFQLDGSFNVVNPPGAYQCFAASKTGDPVAGGWNFYSLHITDFLNDYPKFGIWPDGLYMSANMFGFPSGGAFSGVRVWALNKAQMYAGTPTIQIVSFDVGGGEFTLLPSNARLQTGTPPAGSPNYYSVVGLFTNAVSVYKFHVDWNSISTSTFTGPSIVIAPASWISPPSTVPAQGGNNNDTLAIRLMMQNQYTNIGGVESLWTTHTIRNPTTAGVSAVRYYQTTVTGGTVAATTTQAATHAPDTTNRYMPSVAVDRAGNMALGYSASTAALFPAIRYAGRLSTDPVNTLPLTESSLIEGTGSQNTSTRWGDYSAMTLDPNGCTFWYANEYFITTGNNWQTRIGKFNFSPCTPVTSGTLQGTVTATAGGAPINGAIITFGSRTTTTNPSGFYSFPAIPSGTYPSETASKPGFNSSTTTNIVVSDGAITTRDFSLSAAPLASCFTDTTQADFQTGVPTNVDLTTSAGNVILFKPSLDQQNTTLGGFGVGITTTTWGGQTFTPAVTGSLTKADINLFCAGCTGTTPNLTLSVRATSGGLPTGADLASATITGFSNGGAASYFTVTFGSPPTLTAGTVYALVIRPVANPTAGGTYALTRSGGQFVGDDVYAGGTRVAGATSGTVWSSPTTGGITTDAGFRTYMDSGFTASGDQVSSLKDGNPAAGTFNHWSYISWNAVTPANTTVKFQVAASNNAFGPFNFVGPDGTAATFFTTINSSLFQFGSLRYLKYKAYLSTTNTAVTPTLNDVTVCYFNSASPTAADGAVTGVITDSNGGPIGGVAIQLNGTESRRTITDAGGRYRFDNVDTNGLYTVTPSRVNYSFSPQNRSFSMLGSQATASFTASANSGSNLSPLDSADYFVRQQYLDFLGREPDESGFAFWSGEVNSCGGDQACLERKRINVSAAFFLSIEFQQTGFEVYRMYKAAYGSLPGAPVPVRYGELMSDTPSIAQGVVVNQTGWQQTLENNKSTFAQQFVQRTRFASSYPATMTPAEFVDKLFANAGVTPSGSERADAINEFGSAATSSDATARGRALRRVAESPALAQQESNQAFVLMEYFGYLRRDPNSGPDSDFAGYNFWLNKLNTFGNYQDAEMVKAFLVSSEYRGRFLR